ncbi:MAG TPA: hypothetical protein VKI40_02370 [Terriglobales bacterium]|jgi:transposase|nr:hypothetical protein [Terriglobales bacterium]
MKACGHYSGFERRLEELGHELWLGDAAALRAKVVRQQKTDRRDAEHLLELLLETGEWKRSHEVVPDVARGLELRATV